MDTEKLELREKIPDSSVIENVLGEYYYQRNFQNAVRSTLYSLITVMALALLIATLVLPVVRIYGTSMDPTIQADSIVLCQKTSLPKRGDVLAFFYNNKIIIRRVIGLPGDVVDIGENGLVTVNDEMLEEKYLNQRSLGGSDLEYPYTIPDGYYFVLADNRVEALDSRNSFFGNIQEEDFIGDVFFTVWPLDQFGPVK